MEKSWLFSQFPHLLFCLYICILHCLVIRSISSIWNSSSFLLLRSPCFPSLTSCMGLWIIYFIIIFIWSASVRLSTLYIYNFWWWFFSLFHFFRCTVIYSNSHNESHTLIDLAHCSTVINLSCTHLAYNTSWLQSQLLSSSPFNDVWAYSFFLV